MDIHVFINCVLIHLCLCMCVFVYKYKLLTYIKLLCRKWFIICTMCAKSLLEFSREKKKKKTLCK